MSDLVLRASQWCYEGVWIGLTNWLRVTKEPPALPRFSGESVAQFRPCDGYLSYLKFFFWLGLTTIDGILIVLWLALFVAFPLAGVLITPLALAIIVLPDIIAYIAIHLRYDTTWYVLSDRAMRIRRGIWKIHETTITFENIQNIRLSQGPLQRYFGFADLIVETAGGGGAVHGGEGSAASGAHVGVLEGLANASEIRDLILHQLRLRKTTGLGDDTNRETASDGWSEKDIQLLAEIRLLTAQLNEAN